ncbi:T9SS type A sorting domain-containing protein [Pontibacter pamirensis]|uniref:T9SS type A sorting domain-containing protein n=1 Tax=Pontibacter pamirensis TaxID=2562824 RepID=UPI001F17A168|nr:T9SS type A sorting domain-containing protein [Pontibacter pamirensis]
MAEAEQLSWEVFPNPAQSRLTVRWGEPSARGPASLKVYNSLSQPMLFPLILLSPGSKEATLDISGWPKGLYVIFLES